MHKPKNKYCFGAHISEEKFREILKYFCADETAQKTALYTRVNRNTINKIFYKLRIRIAQESLKKTPEQGEFELDESYFGARRVKGKKGRGAAGKTPVFGLLKRGGNVYVNVVNNCSKASLMPIIEGKILEGSTIHTDGWKAYDGLILNGYTHHRVYHSKDEFARGKSHVNGIESFWSFSKRRLRKLNGVRSDKFHLHLKECEWRWNMRRKNMYVMMLKELRKRPLK